MTDRQNELERRFGEVGAGPVPFSPPKPRLSR